MAKEKETFFWSKEAGKRVKEARNRKGMSQKELCNAANISPQRVLSRIESGGYNPRRRCLENICRALDIGFEEILYGGQVVSDVSASAPAEIKPKDEDKKAVDATEMVTTEPSAVEPVPALTIGKRLRHFRTREDVSQKEVAELLGISQYSVCKHETDRMLPSEEQVERYAAIYSCEVRDIVTDQELTVIRQTDADPDMIKRRAAWETRKQTAASKASKKKKASKSVSSAKKPATQKPAKTGAAMPKPVTQAPAEQKKPVEQKKPAEQKKPVVQDSIVTDAKPATAKKEVKTTLSGNALEFALHVAKEREKTGVSVEKAAEKLGLTPEEYSEFEKGNREITISQLSLLSEVLKISAHALVKESFKKKWLHFRSLDGKSIKDLYAAYGLCMQNGLECINRIAEDTFDLLIYGSESEIKELFRAKDINLRTD